jgi:Transglutaminase-like superfamily
MMNHMLTKLTTTGILLTLIGCASKPAVTAAPASSPPMPATQPVAQTTTYDLTDTVDLVPTDYRHRLVQQLSIAEDNQQSFLKAINMAPPQQREALAYLLVNMPESDLKNLSGDYLLNNVTLAYKARNASDWARAIPQEIFFADVLPYANVDETREDWRQDLYDRCMPLVKDAKSAADAEQILNKKIFPMVKVKYHATKRLKPNQSLSESMKIGYASCTGLSIILADACRAVGVPARLAGTPLWSDHSGNHTWTEVWDHQWYFVGSAEPGKLNHTWFEANAAKADDSQMETRIYAASFADTKMVFPMVWDQQETNVHGVDVTGYYTGRQTFTVKLPPGAAVQLRQNGILQAASSEAIASFDLAVRQRFDVQVVTPEGKVVDSGSITITDGPSTLDLTAILH